MKKLGDKQDKLFIAQERSNQSILIGIPLFVAATDRILKKVMNGHRY